MSDFEVDARACRPREHLLLAGQLYPQAWADIEHMRSVLRGRTAPDWPQWCFVPIAGAQAAVANDAGIDVAMLGALYPSRVIDAARLAALAAWRMTQGIYRFDPAVFEAVSATPVTGDIPDELLLQLPEWCIYIETPGLHLGTSPVHGAFAHLEWDVNVQRTELRLLLDADALTPLPIHLGRWPLAEAIDKALTVASVTSLGPVAWRFRAAPPLHFAPSWNPSSVCCCTCAPKPVRSLAEAAPATRCQYARAVAVGNFSQLTRRAPGMLACVSAPPCARPTQPSKPARVSRTPGHARTSAAATGTPTSAALASGPMVRHCPAPSAAPTFAGNRLSQWP